LIQKILDQNLPLSQIVNLAIDNWKKYDPEYKLVLPIKTAKVFIDEIEEDIMNAAQKRDSAKLGSLSEDEKKFLEIHPSDGLEDANEVMFADVVKASLRQIMFKSTGTKEGRTALMSDIDKAEEQLQEVRYCVCGIDKPEEQLQEVR
jgi:hypothetical protein